MKKLMFEEPRGFHVVHESKGWRIACHSYKNGVNSINDMNSWGIHEDSEETFILVKGRMLLATCGTIKNPEKMSIVFPQIGEAYVVSAGEKHVIALEEDTIVAIAENLDMSRFIEVKIEDDEKSMIRKEWLI